MLALGVLAGAAVPGHREGAQDALLAQDAAQEESFDEPSTRDLLRRAFGEQPLREPNEEQFYNATGSVLAQTRGHVWSLKPLHGQSEKFCKKHQKQPSWSECREAVFQALGGKEGVGSKLEHTGLKTISDGADRPKGCFFDHVHGTAMYNTHKTGGSDTKLHRPICGDPICNNNLCAGTGSCTSSCASKKSLFRLKSAPGKHMPYYHSTMAKMAPFSEEPQPEVRLGLIVMHGAQRDGQDYLCRLQNAITHHLGSVGRATRETVLVAPQVALSGHHKEYPYKPIRESHLSWGRANMVGMEDHETLLSWSAGANSSGVPSTSLFDVLDEMVEAMTNRTTYPNLEKVMIVGHSKGASVVLRYAMATTIIRKLPVPIGFHAANPSALVYVSPDRPVPPEHFSCGYRDSKRIATNKFTFKPIGESKFAVALFDTCSAADQWPYGLGGNFPDYVTRNWPLGPEGVNLMREAFFKKHVNIYSGDADTCNSELHEQLKCYPTSCKMNDCDMEVSCPAMYQGVNRMTRIRAYMQQKEIVGCGHKLVNVPKSGHNSCIMFQSQEMRTLLFDKLLHHIPYEDGYKTGGNKLKHKEPSSSVSLSSSTSASASASSSAFSSSAADAAAFIATAASNGIAAAASKAIADATSPP